MVALFLKKFFEKPLVFRDDDGALTYVSLNKT